jgi:hypothetical protein
VFTHTPPQLVGVAASQQSPDEHDCPLPQALPQLPQSVLLVVRFTHTPPQFVVPVGQQIPFDAA